MDTPDNARGMSDSAIADAVNKDWLSASIRSSQLSTDLNRYQLEVSSSSHYGATARSIGRQDTVSAPPGARSNETTWLLRNYSGPKNSSDLSYTINGHLYDNISFADSPIIVRSLSRKANPRGLDFSWSSSIKSQYEEVHDDNQPRGCITGKFRYFLAIYVLLGITLAIYSRNALSLAAVGMIANNVINKELIELMSINSQHNSSHNYLEGSCPILNAQDSSDQTTNLRLQLLSSPGISRADLEANLRESTKRRIALGELINWSPAEQGLIFAAGSIGNLLIAIPLTRMGEIYGPKWIIFLAIFGATIQAALMPVVAPSHVAIVIVFQVIFNGLTFGADCVAYTLFAHWLTPTEMAFFVGCLLICYQMGTIISSAVTARILTRGLGWSWCFYTPAILCGLWATIWMFVGASDPSKSPIISKGELAYLQRRSKITDTSGSANDLPNADFEPEKRNNSVSWLKLAKDPNIWAIISVKFTLRWYFSAYMSLMPTYLSSVAHMSVSTIGRMNVFQSVVGLVSGILMGYMTKSVVSSRPFNISLSNFRKIFQSIVNFGLAISLLVFITYDCNQWVTISALTLSGICINFYVAAALQLPLDLSPDHCGLITSITNTLALGQALGAPISGLILDAGPKSRRLWRVVWFVAIILNTLSGLLFIVLVDSKPRDYSKGKRNNLESASVEGD